MRRAHAGRSSSRCVCTAARIGQATAPLSSSRLRPPHEIDRAELPSVPLGSHSSLLPSCVVDVPAWLPCCSCRFGCTSSTRQPDWGEATPITCPPRQSVALCKQRRDRRWSEPSTARSIAQTPDFGDGRIPYSVAGLGLDHGVPTRCSRERRLQLGSLATEAVDHRRVECVPRSPATATAAPTPPAR